MQDPAISRPHHLGTSLAIIRLTVAAFLLVWSVEKILFPDRAAGIFKAFYSIESLPVMAVIGIGLVQTALVLAFACGLWKTWTYGIVLLMHAVSTLSTIAQLADPYEGINHLFWAAVPVLGALVALFLLRESDAWLTVGGVRKEN